MENDVPLGPADYVFMGAGSVPITFAFFFPSPLDPVVLRESLSETVRVFPTVQSLLVKVTESDYAMRISESGLAFEILESEQSFPESRSIGRYITPVDSVEGHPLSRISLTRTADGSVLAASMSHALVDGFSFFHFLSSWARVCRGERFLPPDLSRGWVSLAPANGAEPVTSTVLLERCGLHLAGRRKPHLGRGVQEDRIPISNDQLQALLAEAKHDKPEAAFSENDVVTAWLWKRFLPQWIKQSGDSKTYLSCPVDCRRIYRALPRRYFGCALCFASESAGLSDLHQASLGELALLVHGSVRRVNNDFASESMGTLELFRRQQGLAAMEHIHLKHPERGMIVTNLTRMPLRDLDFGVGAPADFLVHSDVSGSAAMLPAENGIMAVVIHP